MTARDAIERLRRADPLQIWGFGLAAALMLFTIINLATRSMWWDELFTMVLADPSTPEADAIAQIRGDVHPPLYFMAVRWWMQLLNSSSDYVARAFNILPYAFAIGVAAHAYVRRLAQPLTMWLVLFFTAFGVLWFLQEARMYAMMIAQSLCGCLMVLDFEKRRLEPVKPGYVALLGAIFVVLPLGHWFSLAFAGLLLIGLLGWALLERRLQYAALFLVLGLALAGLGGAWIVTNVRSTVDAVDSYGGWVFGGTVSVYGLRVAGTGVLLHALTLNPILILAAGVGVWRIVRSPSRQIGPLIIFAASAVLVLAIIGVSFVAAMYQTRNFNWLIAPLALFAAIGLEHVFAQFNLSRARQTVAVMLILAVSAAISPFAGKLSQLDTDAWRPAGKFIASLPGCGESEIHATAYWLGKTPPALDYRYSQRMLGYYAGNPERMKLVLPGQTLTVDKTSECPVVLWGAQMNPETAGRAARDILGPEAAADLETKVFEAHVVFVRREARLATH